MFVLGILEDSDEDADGMFEPDGVVSFDCAMKSGFGQEAELSLDYFNEGYGVRYHTIEFVSTQLPGGIHNVVDGSYVHPAERR